jgi:HSP20 family protein
MAEPRHEVSRWNPFGDFEALAAFTPFRDFPRFSRTFDEMVGSANGGSGRFALDVTESDDGYIISAELPGVKREDLTIECTNGVLTIRGEKKSEREEKHQRSRLVERSYGSFSRALRLPEDADVDKSKAEFKDGVLRLEIQKRPEAKAKTIAIKG